MTFLALNTNENVYIYMVFYPEIKISPNNKKY
jgi:hypothetical protein